jgi:hypothetical protein
VKLKVLRVYVEMLSNQGRYLAANGRHDRAIRAYEQALALSPDLDRTRLWLDESVKALRNDGSAR